MNYFQLHIGDYEKATSHLTAVEDGIYNRLLRRYYDTERPIPSDVKAVQRLVRARSKEEREAVETVLAEFFVSTSDGWAHTRCDEEIAQYKSKQEKAKASANARWGGKRQQCERNANASKANPEAECERIAEAVLTNNQEPITRQEKKHKSLVQRAARSAARFPEFWAAYPVKKGRAEALAKWTARGLDAIADRIIADVQARKSHDRQWLDGYAPHGSTYVNGRGWEDEIAAVRNPRGVAAAGVFGVAL